MAVKDRLVDWFIKNIMTPGMEIVDKPGLFSSHPYQQT